MQRSVREPSVYAATCILAMALACGGKSAPAPATATIQAEAGPDQAVASGALVTLDGTVTTDPAGLPVTYAWSQASGTPVTLSGATTKNPTFTAPAVTSGQPPSPLVFSLVASAAAVTSAPSTVTVTVSAAPPQHADPVAHAGADQSVVSATAVTLDGRSSVDPQGAPLTFAWTQSSGSPVTLAGANTAQPTFTAPVVVDGDPPKTLIFSLVVSDSQASSAPASVIVTVNSLSTASFPPPPGTPPPASPTPTPLPVGGNGSNRFEMGAAQGLYLQDPASGEPTVSGFVVVNLSAAGGGLPGNAPADTVVTMNGVRLLRDPNLNGNFFRLDPGPQPSIGWGGQMVLVATGTDPKDGKPIQRTLVLPCPKDIQVTSAPAIGSVVTGVPSLQVTSPSDITFNVGVPLMANIFPTVQLFGYVRATRTLAPSGAAINIAPGPLDVTVPVTTTAADAYLLDLRWPGVFILDGQTGGFCGLAKRWTYAK